MAEGDGKPSRKKPNKLSPQDGPQREFLTCQADIAFFGGSAGGGKSAGLLLDFLMHYKNSEARGICFRRTTPQITGPGGLWENAEKFYRPIGAKSKRLEFTFPSGAKIGFSHLEHLTTMYDHQGSEYAVILFDELGHILEQQFWYLQSRNRSTSTIRPYMRATMNPMPPGHWINNLIKWYIGQDGTIIKERSGVIRWFYRILGEIHWGDSKEELEKKFPDQAKDAPPISFTFIRSTLEDNQILMEKDPSYKAKLLALPFVDRERLYGGNWKVVEGAGSYFKRKYFPAIPQTQLPENLVTVRAWDLAATSAKEVAERKQLGIKQAHTASVRLSLDTSTGFFYVTDVTNDLLGPDEVEAKLEQIVKLDGPYVTVALFQDPGQAGKVLVEYWRKRLQNYNVFISRESGTKESRAGPVSARAERGWFKIVHASWNEIFLTQAENFPEGNKDIIDALSGAFGYFVEHNLVSMDLYPQEKTIITPSPKFSPENRPVQTYDQFAGPPKLNW